VLLHLPTYSPWPKPFEMLWRHFRHEVIHCERFPSVKALTARQPMTSSTVTTNVRGGSSRTSARTPQKCTLMYLALNILHTKRLLV
jgi:hypothetical protein